MGQYERAAVVSVVSIEFEKVLLPSFKSTIKNNESDNERYEITKYTEHHSRK